MSKVAIVEDDTQTSELLAEFLSLRGYTVSCFENPVEFLRCDTVFDIAVVDVMMPKMSGLELVRTLKAKTNMPVIIASARCQTSDKVLGLELGADDYLAKPFDSLELAARIEAVLRRGGSVQKGVWGTGDFLVDENARQIKLNEEVLELTTAEYELLKFLLRHCGQALSRDAIAASLPSFEWDSSGRNLDMLVSKLRSKLKDDAKNPRFIKAVWGFGYQFIGVGS